MDNFNACRYSYSIATTYSAIFDGEICQYFAVKNCSIWYKLSARLLSQYSYRLMELKALSVNYVISECVSLGPYIQVLHVCMKHVAGSANPPPKKILLRYCTQVVLLAIYVQYCMITYAESASSSNEPIDITLISWLGDLQKQSEHIAGHAMIL